MTYQRDQELGDRINAFLISAFDLPDKDYYQGMDLDSLLRLKTALSDVNNSITMRLTLEFVDWASHALSLGSDSVSILRSSILSTKPSSNGYDVHHFGDPSFVAEVKCNVPINGGSVYGSAQRNNIIKDINQLMMGKSKAAAISLRTLKFMVFMGTPQIRAANEQLVRTSSEVSRVLRFASLDGVPNIPDCVHGIYLKFAT